MPFSYTPISDANGQGANWAAIGADYKSIDGFCGGAYVCNFRVKFFTDRPLGFHKGYEACLFPGVSITEDEKAVLLKSLAVSIIEEAADRERTVLFFYNGDKEAQSKGDEYRNNVGDYISFDELIEELGGKVISQVINPNTGFNINVWMADVTEDPRTHEARDRMLMDEDYDDGMDDVLY